MPVQIVKALNCSSTARPTSACATRKPAAAWTLTCPDGIGRERVRSTLASRSRSTMSFQVQPAPRMAKAPTKNSSDVPDADRMAGVDRRRGRATTSTGSTAARNRSADRDERAADKDAAKRARGYRPSFRLHRRRVRPRRSSREWIAGQGLECAGALLILRVGQRRRRAERIAQRRAGGAGPRAAASQTCLPICCALAWLPLTCWLICGGTPQDGPFASSILSIFASVAR